MKLVSRVSASTVSDISCWVMILNESMQTKNGDTIHPGRNTIPGGKNPESRYPIYDGSLTIPIDDSGEVSERIIKVTVIGPVFYTNGNYYTDDIIYNEAYTIDTLNPLTFDRFPIGHPLWNTIDQTKVMYHGMQLDDSELVQYAVIRNARIWADDFSLYTWIVANEKKDLYQLFKLIAPSTLEEWASNREFVLYCMDHPDLEAYFKEELSIPISGVQKVIAKTNLFFAKLSSKLFG